MLLLFTYVTISTLPPVYSDEVLDILELNFGNQEQFPRNPSMGASEAVCSEAESSGRKKDCYLLTRKRKFDSSDEPGDLKHCNYRVQFKSVTFRFNKITRGDQIVLDIKKFRTFLYEYHNCSNGIQKCYHVPGFQSISFFIILMDAKPHLKVQPGLAIQQRPLLTSFIIFLCGQNGPYP
jgi:hypothetical protein